MTLPPDILVRSLPVDERLLADTPRVLTEEERERMASFRSEGRRRSFAAGRIAARRLLGEQLGIPPDRVPLQVHEDGSVRLPGDPLHLSISHSETRAVVAVSPAPVGADVERICVRPAALFRFVLHPDEFRLVDTVDLPDDRKLVVFWTLKEAVLKGRRTGLRQSPKALRLNVDLADGRARIATPGDDADWTARFEIEGDFVTSIAWPEPAG